MSSNTERARAGLLDSFRGLLGTGLSLSKNRLELLGVELAEERLRVFALLTYGAAAFTLLSAGAVFLAIFLTVLLWDTQRLVVLGMFAMLFIGAGVVSLMVTLSYARAESRLFAASVAELGKDKDALHTASSDNPAISVIGGSRA